MVYKMFKIYYLNQLNISIIAGIVSYLYALEGQI